MYVRVTCESRRSHCGLALLWLLSAVGVGTSQYAQPVLGLLSQSSQLAHIAATVAQCASVPAPATSIPRCTRTRAAAGSTLADVACCCHRCGVCAAAADWESRRCFLSMRSATTSSASCLCSSSGSTACRSAAAMCGAVDGSGRGDASDGAERGDVHDRVEAGEAGSVWRCGARPSVDDEWRLGSTGGRLGCESGARYGSSSSSLLSLR